MSKEQAVAFFEEISKNTQLAQKVEKVVGGKGSDEAKAKELISLAQRYNFNFTPDEAVSAQGSLKKPLSPEETLEVSGGKLNLKSSVMAAAMLLGLGATGATLHNMEASAMKRRLADFSSSSDSGKRGKDENGRPRKNGNRSQTQHATTGTANPEQRQTPPGNGQGSTPSNSEQPMIMTPHSRPRTTSGEERHAPRPTKEKKAWAYKEHDKKAAKRFGGSYTQVEWARRVSASGALPAADWPAAPHVDLEAENGVCRFCGGTLSARGKKALDVKCANAGCIYNWVFQQTGNKQLKGNQRGQKDFGHYARWVLLPALILDSRHKYINSTGNGGRGGSRKLAIETPAEAWAVWQLIAQRRPDGTWPDISSMMGDHKVSPATQDKVINLLNGSYAHLGSEIPQLVAGHNNGWLDILEAMDQRGYDASTVNTAIARLEHAYNMLTNEQLNAARIAPDTVARNPASTLDEILKELTQDLDDARRQREAARQQREAEKEQARRQREAARQQVIEKLPHKEKLSLEEARVIAPMLTCGNCGDTGANASKNGKYIRFQCKKCKKAISKKPSDLLAMLEEVAAENAPVEMADAEQDEPPMQLEIQPMQMNHWDAPTYEINFPWDTAPQMGMQGMNQFNLGQQMMQQNMSAMKMDDDDDYEYNFDMGYQELQQQPPMMNQNEFNFNFGGHDVNQFYIAQPTQQTFDPNLFNASNEQSFNIHRIPVLQMDINRNDTQQQDEQIDPLNMNQIHITYPAQPVDQLLVMLQHTQVDQDQQPINDQPGLTFGPTQVLQQLAAQQNVTQPQQNPNENLFTWQFDAEDTEDDPFTPGSWGTWGGPRRGK